MLALIARGSRNKEIAVELTISEFTVRRHVQNILQKLSLPSRRSAAAFYRSAFEPELGRVACLVALGPPAGGLALAGGPAAAHAPARALRSGRGT